MPLHPLLRVFFDLFVKFIPKFRCPPFFTCNSYLASQKLSTLGLQLFILQKRVADSKIIDNILSNGGIWSLFLKSYKMCTFHFSHTRYCSSLFFLLFFSFVCHHRLLVPILYITTRSTLLIRKTSRISTFFALFFQLHKVHSTSRDFTYFSATWFLLWYKTKIMEGIFHKQ